MPPSCGIIPSCFIRKGGSSKSSDEMGKKGNWFSAVKKALHHEHKDDDDSDDNNNQPSKSNKKWFKKKKHAIANISTPESTPTTTTVKPTVLVTTPAPPPIESPISSGVEKEQKNETYTPPIVEQARPSGVDREQTKHAQSVALATAKVAEADAAAAQAAAEVVRLTTSGPFADVPNEELAAIKIQTLFRGYMARRRLRAIRGLIRLKKMVQGQAGRRQSTNTLKCMQTLARMQTQIRERRIRMAEEAIARQVQNKKTKEQVKDLQKSQKIGDGWDASGKTKEQIEARLQSKQEAAVRRERTLAYAFSHQQTWKASAMSGNTQFMDSNNPHWGWSWLERWLAARPWDSTALASSNENSPRLKGSKSAISGEEILKAYTKRHYAKKPSPSSLAIQPRSSTARRSTSSARKVGSPSPKAGPRSSVWGQDNDDTTSMNSEQSRRVSVTGSDAESQASSQNVPSYMAPTEAAKARSRFASESKRDKSVTPDRSSVSSTKKWGSHTASPARSRISNSSAADGHSISDQTYNVN